MAVERLIFLIIEIISVVLVLLLGVAVSYLYKRNQVQKAKHAQLDEADRVLEAAKEEARQIEIQNSRPGLGSAQES